MVFCVLVEVVVETVATSAYLGVFTTFPVSTVAIMVMAEVENLLLNLKTCVLYYIFHYCVSSIVLPLKEVRG